MDSQLCKYNQNALNLPVQLSNQPITPLERSPTRKSEVVLLNDKHHMQLLNMLVFFADRQDGGKKKNQHTPVTKGSFLSQSMGKGNCAQPYPCICKETISRFKHMTNWSPRHNLPPMKYDIMIEIECISRTKNIVQDCMALIYVAFLNSK